MLFSPRLLRRSSRRRAVAKAKLTFKSFSSNIRPQHLGERAVALQIASVPEKSVSPKNSRVLVIGLLLAFASLSSTYVIVGPLVMLDEPNFSSGGPTVPKDATCGFSFSDTIPESRTKSIFGGVKVETGEVECRSEFFIVTQTSNSDGDVLSVKKKRA